MDISYKVGFEARMSWETMACWLRVKEPLRVSYVKPESSPSVAVPHHDQADHPNLPDRTLLVRYLVLSGYYLAYLT